MRFRDRDPNRFKRPDFLDRPPLWDRKATKGLHRPDWLERRRQRSTNPNRLARPNFLDRPKRAERNPNRLTRPDWLDRISYRNLNPDRIKVPELSATPRRARRNPDRLKRPDILDRPGGVPRWSKVLAAVAAVVLLAGAAVVVLRSGGGGGGGSVNGAGTPGAGGTPAAASVSLTQHGLVPRRIGTLPTAGTAVTTRSSDGRLFVAEGGGQVWTLHTEPGAARILLPAVDLRPTMGKDPGNALAGLAVAADGRHLYVSYTDVLGRSLVVVEFAMDKDNVDQGSLREVLRVPVPGTSFMGGDLAIGPDGLLYVSVGDGAPGIDLSATGRSQVPTDLSGKILRIDPTQGAPSTSFGPADNPNSNLPRARPEIWASGVHEATGLSWDPVSADLWLADRGGQRVDEIDKLLGPKAGRGANLGWDLAEGDLRFKGIPPDDAVRPTVSLPITAGRDCPVQGGYFYQAAAVTGPAGVYLYSDGCEHSVKAMVPATLTHPASAVSASFLPDEEVSAIGDGKGLGPIVLGIAGGVYRLEPSASTTPPLPGLVEPPAADPPSTVKDLCGLSDAIAILNPVVLQGPPAVVEQVVERTRSALAAYRAVTPPAQQADLDVMVSIVDSLSSTLRGNGYVLDQGRLRDVQATLQTRALHPDGTGPLANLVTYEVIACPGPKLIDLGTR